MGLRAEVERCLLDWEIIASILYCSTNYTCNPQANIIEQMSPDDPYYASLPTSMKSVPIKQEPMSQEVSDTVPANTCPDQWQDHAGPTANDDTVPANTVPTEDHDTAPANTVPVNTLPTGQDDDDGTMANRSVLHEEPSCVIAESLDPEEDTNNKSNNQRVEPIIKSEPLHDDEQESSLAEFDFESQPMDVDDFFDDIFKQQEEQKRRIQSHQQERKEEEARRIQLQQQEQEEEARRIQLQQQEEEAHRIRLQQQEQQEQTRRLQQQQEEEEQARHLEQEEQNDHEYQQRLSEERSRVQEEYEQDMQRRRRQMQQEDGIENDSNNQESNNSAASDIKVQKIGEFTTVQYAPLIVRPRPQLPQEQERASSSGGVNYKRFKKVQRSIVIFQCLFIHNIYFLGATIST